MLLMCCLSYFSSAKLTQFYTFYPNSWAPIKKTNNTLKFVISHTSLIHLNGTTSVNPAFSSFFGYDWCMLHKKSCTIIE